MHLSQAVILGHSGKYSNLVLNMDETGLFWKMLPSRSFLSNNKWQILDCKSNNDRLHSFWELMQAENLNLTSFGGPLGKFTSDERSSKSKLTGF